MNHVAMNPHLSEAGRHRYGLVGNHPHFRSPTISLHREPNGSAIDRANPNLFQCRDDSARHFVGLVCRVMEFELREGTSRRPAVLQVHADADTNVRTRTIQNDLHIRLLYGLLWLIPPAS